MKKFLMLTLIAVLALLAFTSCGWVDEGECAHEVTIKIAGKAATCEADGLTEGKKCDDCGAIVVAQQTIAKLDHTVVTIPAVEGTCTVKGKTDGKKCSACDLIIEAPQETDYQHKRVDKNYVAPTCTRPGSTGGAYCSACLIDLAPAGELAALGHLEATASGKAATCTEAGYTEKVYCTREGCGTTITASVEIPVDTTKHPADQLVVVKGVAAICGSGVDGWSDGEKCNACNTVTKVNEKVAPAASHTMVEVAGAVAPNCETKTDGKTAHEKCSTCGYEVVPQTIPYTHDYAGWVDAGNNKQTNSCVDCGHTITKDTSAGEVEEGGVTDNNWDVNG